MAVTPEQSGKTRFSKKKDPARRAFYQKLGQDLRNIREDAGFTQEELGEMVGVNRDAISKSERGKTFLDVFEYLFLVHALREHAPSHPGVMLSRRLYVQPPLGALQAQQRAQRGCGS